MFLLSRKISACGEQHRLLGALLATSFFLASALRAQTPESKVHWFAGGRVRVQSDLILASGWDFGLTLRERYLTAFNPVWNPSFVYPVRKANLRFTGGLPYRINLGSFADLNGTAKTELDGALAPYRAKDTEIQYPDIQALSHLSSFFDQVAISFRVGRSAFNAFVQRTLATRLAADLFDAGTRVSTAVDAGGVPMNVVLNARIAGSMKWRLDFYRIGLRWARPTGQKSVLGVSLVRQTLDTRAVGMVHTDAAMLYAGQEYAFNDPNSLWPTDLDQRLDGHYHGSGWLLRVGMWRLLRPTTILDLSLQGGGPVIARGKLDIIQNRIPAFNIDALIWGDEGAELLDASRLKLTQLTLTERVDNPTYAHLKLTVPASFRFGLVQRSCKADAAFATTVFVGDYTLSYGPSALSLAPVWRFEGLLTYGRFTARLALLRVDVSVHGSEHFETVESGYFFPDASLSYTLMAQPGLVFSHTFRLLPVPGYFLQIGVDL